MSYISRTIDAESRIKGLDQIVNNWVPPQKLVKESKSITKPASSSSVEIKSIEQTETRTSKSCTSNSHINRFENLAMNYQDTSHIIMNEPHRGGVNTRNQAKDTYTC